MSLDVQKVAAAIHSSRTRKEAAKKLGVSERVIYDYLKNYEVQAAMKLLRYEVYARTVSGAVDSVADALAALREIVTSDTATNPERIRAAGILLDFGRQSFRDVSAAESETLADMRGASEAEDERNGILHFNFGEFPAEDAEPDEDQPDEPGADYLAMIANLLENPAALAACYDDSEPDED